MATRPSEPPYALKLIHHAQQKVSLSFCLPRPSSPLPASSSAPLFSLPIVALITRIIFSCFASGPPPDQGNTFRSICEMSLRAGGARAFPQLLPQPVIWTVHGFTITKFNHPPSPSSLPFRLLDLVARRNTRESPPTSLAAISWISSE